MAKLTDRENAFENKFAHDKQMDFKIEARAVKLFGLWIAEKLGLSGEAAAAYAADAISTNLDEPGFNDVLRKVRTDLDTKKVAVSDHALQTELNKNLERARIQILSETQ
jgi:hypothetical protein